MEVFYMALADNTRLRLLNLMRDREICVCFFTEVLGDSQPKISRHLAYLRHAGLVAARRDGKWMHYSIKQPTEAGAQQVLEAALQWLDSKADMRADRQKYETVCCAPDSLVQIDRTETPVLYAQADIYKDGPANHSPRHNDLEEFLL